MELKSSSQQQIARMGPMEQTASWTFALALAVIKTNPQDATKDAFDEFLLSNKDIFLLPLPFAEPKSRSKPLPPSTKEFTLRGILYTGVTPEIIATAEEISLLTECEFLDCLRVIIQTNLRNPESKQLLESKSSSENSLLLDLNPTSRDSQKRKSIQLYLSALLNERLCVLELVTHCFNKRFDEDSSLAIRKMGSSLVHSTYVSEVISSLDKMFRKLSDSASVSYVASEDNEASQSFKSFLFAETYLHLILLLKLFYEICLTIGTVDKSLVSSWFDLMNEFSFAFSLGLVISEKESFTLLHALCTLISLQMFDLNWKHKADDEKLYILDGSVFFSIDKVMQTTKSNSILRYAWLIVLFRKSIVLEELPNENTSFKQNMTLTQVKNSTDAILNSNDHSSVFQEIEELSDFFLFDEVYSVVLVDLILSSLPLITMSDEIASCIAKTFRGSSLTSVQAFFEDDEAKQAIVLARAKFPLSLTPFLKLASINGDFAFHEFLQLKSYMCSLNRDEFGRMYNIDSDNTELVTTTKSLELFPPFESNKKLALLIGSNTKAKIIADVVDTNDEKKTLVTILYHYNGWAFLGRVMENITKTFDHSDNEKLAVLSDMVDLMIQTCSQNGPNEVSSILEYMSAYNSDSDFMDILFRLFEQAMHHRDILLLEKLLRLLASLMPIASSRIWPYLASSSLIPNKGKEGFMSVLFGAIEMVSGDYSFTLSLVNFVFALSENCLSNTKDYPEDAKSRVLSVFVGHLILVFECCNTAKFNTSYQKFELAVLILDVFTRILETIYLICPNTPPNQKPTKVFSNPSKSILLAFLFTNQEFTRSAAPIFDLIKSLSSEINVYELRDVSGYCCRVWVESAFAFSRLLVTIRSSIKESPTAFEKELFSHLPELVVIYSRGGYNRKPILDLLSALTSGVWESEPMPSMLSHIGKENSRMLLHSLATDLDNPFDDYAIKVSIYDFLCSIVEASQQGLAVLFISGRDVFGELSLLGASSTKSVGAGDKDNSTISLLSIMKRNMNHIKYYPPSVTAHLLDAVSLAYNSWTTPRDEESDVLFLKELVSRFSRYSKPDQKSVERSPIEAAYQCKVTAKIAEILSLVLFTTKNDKSKQSVIELLSSEEFILKIPDFFTTTNYRTSLHDSIMVKFEAAFPGFKLADFSVASTKRNRFGSGALYDLKLMDASFQANPQWGELREEIVASSANIQLYNAQIGLSKSLGALLAAFCRREPERISLAYFGIVSKLLVIREPRDSYTESFYAQQNDARIELSFLLTYTMSGVGTKPKTPQEAINIIGACVDLLQSHDIVTLGSKPASVVIPYRSLLRTVYILLSGLDFETDYIGQNSRIFHTLFDFVIAKGTRNIVVELENDVYLSRTKKEQSYVGSNLDDLRLILSILKTFVRLPMDDSAKTDFLNSLELSKTVDSLLGLYAFSHLIMINDEPVFAQLSMLFIQQLLIVDVFAKKIVNSQLFNVIRESPISQPLRNGEVTVLNAPSLLQNWTHGVLPVLVACLVADGRPDEVILSLKAFSNQIELCVESWSKDSSSLQVSRVSAFETIQILCIAEILNRTFSDGSGLDVEVPILRGLETQQKREDLAGYISNLLKHPNFLASRIAPSTAEEAAMLKADGNARTVFIESVIEEIQDLKDFFV